MCSKHLVKRVERPCPPPFVLFPFATEVQNPETRKEWIKAVYRKDAKTKRERKGTGNKRRTREYALNIFLKVHQLKAFQIQY